MENEVIFEIELESLIRKSIYIQNRTSVSMGKLPSMLNTIHISSGNKPSML